MESACWWNYGNGAQLQSTWLQSKLSDLEENTKSMLTLIKLENGDSFAERAETYYQKKPELEKRIAKYQQLYRLLLDHYSPILSRSSISSISTVNDFEPNNSLRNSLKIELSNSNSNPDSCVEDFHQETVGRNVPKLREINPKILEIEISNLKLNPKSCIEEIKLETHVNNVPKLREINPKMREMREKYSLEKIINGDIFERLVDFEKRMSCSEELVEDNKRHVDELTRRYEEKNEANKKLKEQIHVLMKEIEFLQNENLMLLSKKQRSINEVIVDRVKEKKWAKFWRNIGVKQLEGLVKRLVCRKNEKGILVSA